MIVQIPDERLGPISIREGDAVVDVAIGLYKREEVSLGRAAEIAGISTSDFLNELARRHIPINYDAADVRADVETLDRLHRG